MGKAIVLLLAVVILGIGLYIYSSGALNAGISSLGSIAHFPTGTFSFIFAPIGSGGVPTVTTIGPATAPASTQPSSGAVPAINPADIPAGFTASQLSPFFHEIRIGGASYGAPPSYGTITLYTNLSSASETVDITGWQLKTQRGGEYIPQAIEMYDPSGLTPATDIRVKSGDTVSLYSTPGPFNVRVNECIGYIAGVANFNPPLPMNCPYVDRSEIQMFTGECQNYILSLGDCAQPNMADIRNPQSDYSCVDYLENHFNYTSCYDEHRADADFLSNQVMVWMGSNIVDQFHDNVELLDRSGLLVDEYQY